MRSAQSQTCPCIHGGKKFLNKLGTNEKAVYSKALVYGPRRSGVIFFYCCLFTPSLFTVAKIVYMMPWNNKKTKSNVGLKNDLRRTEFSGFYAKPADVRIFHSPTPKEQISSWGEL